MVPSHHSHDGKNEGAKKPPRLRSYQGRHHRYLVEFLTRNEPHVAIVYTTGAGKTLMALALVGKMLGGGFPYYTHAVYAAPTKVIQAAFEGDRYVVDGDGNAIYIPKVINEGGDIQTYLSLPPSDDWRTLSLTHARLCKMGENGELDGMSLKGKILVLDEAHHAGKGREVTAVRDKWLAAGGTVVSLTATPTRSDQEVVLGPNVPRVAWTWTEHAADGYCPGYIDSEIALVEGEWRTTKTTLFDPLREKAIAKALVEHYLAELDEGRLVKAVTRLKDAGDEELGGEANRRILSELVKTLREHKVRVFVESKAHSGDPEIHAANQAILESIPGGAKDLIDVLAYERDVKSFEDSRVDMILGMNVVGQGMDWPLCSHVYFIGIPYAMLPCIQGVGRATRLKNHVKGYPKQYVDRAKAVFLTAGDTSKIGPEHLRHIRKVACYLATFYQWSPRRSANDNFGKHWPSSKVTDEVLDHVSKSDILDDVRPEVDSVIHTVKEILERHAEIHGRYSNEQLTEAVMVYVDPKQGIYNGPPITKEDVLKTLRCTSKAAKKAYEETLAKGAQDGLDPVEAHDAAIEAADKACMGDDADETSYASEIMRPLFGKSLFKLQITPESAEAEAKANNMAKMETTIPARSAHAEVLESIGGRV